MPVAIRGNKVPANLAELRSTHRHLCRTLALAEAASLARTRIRGKRPILDSLAASSVGSGKKLRASDGGSSDDDVGAGSVRSLATSVGKSGTVESRAGAVLQKLSVEKALLAQYNGNHAYSTRRFMETCGKSALIVKVDKRLRMYTAANKVHINLVEDGMDKDVLSDELKKLVDGKFKEWPQDYCMAILQNHLASCEWTQEIHDALEPTTPEDDFNHIDSVPCADNSRFDVYEPRFFQIHLGDPAAAAWHFSKCFCVAIQQLIDKGPRSMNMLSDLRECMLNGWASQAAKKDRASQLNDAVEEAKSIVEALIAL